MSPTPATVTDEHNATARRIVDGVGVGGTLDGWLFRAIAQALADAEAAERERIAKWHDERSEICRRASVSNSENVDWWNTRACVHEDSAAAIRAGRAEG